MSQSKNYKKNFTLLEIIIATLILAICSSIIGININKAINKHRFANNIKKMDEAFEFCKKMALCNQADIYMNLQNDKHNAVILIGTSEDMGLFKNLKKTKIVLKSVKFYLDEGPVVDKEITFSSTGKVSFWNNITIKDARGKSHKFENI